MINCGLSLKIKAAVTSIAIAISPITCWLFVMIRTILKDSFAKLHNKLMAIKLLAYVLTAVQGLFYLIEDKHLSNST